MPRFAPPRTSGTAQYPHELAIQVTPIITPDVVRGLCSRPYPGHPRGCPNHGKKAGCPPKAPLFDRRFDVSRPVYAVVNEFDLGAHVERMRDRHPGWSRRQLECCLYWQAGARKRLGERVTEALRCLSIPHGWTFCPEAMGVNVTATLELAGIALEWPPVKIARQVALLAQLRRA